MIDVEGIILILSCEKHRYTRLKKCGLNENQINNWKVIKVIGDLFLDKPYKLKGNFLLLKCEDSYLHLLKKLGLSIKYLYEIFKIKQGILRCGDDLIFDKIKLNEFLNSKKYDFYGQSFYKKNYISSDLNNLKKTKYDPFMIDYYTNHQDELYNSKHGINLSLEELNNFMVRPDILSPAGVIYYLSNEACQIIINTMEKINYNIFHLDKFTNSYPYIIEDIGITYIMYYNKINFTDSQQFYDNKNSIVKHTNMYKYDHTPQDRSISLFGIARVQKPIKLNKVILVVAILYGLFSFRNWRDV